MEQQHITYLGSVPYMPMRQPQMEAKRFLDMGELIQRDAGHLGDAMDKYARYKQDEARVQDIKNFLRFDTDSNKIALSLRDQIEATQGDYAGHKKLAENAMKNISSMQFDFSDDLNRAKFEAQRQRKLDDINYGVAKGINDGRIDDARKDLNANLKMYEEQKDYNSYRNSVAFGMQENLITQGEADLMNYEANREERMLKDPDGLLRDYYSGAVHLSPSDFNRCVGNSSSQGDSMADDAVSGKKQFTEADVDSLRKQGFLSNAIEYKAAQTKARGTFDMEKPAFISECLKDIDTLLIVDPDGKAGTQAALLFKSYWKDRIGLDDSEVNSILNVWKTKAKSKNESIDFSGMKSSLVGMGALNGTQYTVNLNAPDTKLLDGGDYSVKGTLNAKSVSDTDGKIKDKNLWTSEEKAKYEQLETSAKLDADNNWFSVVQKWNGWRASEGSNANKVEQLDMFRKYIEDVTGKKVPLDISTMASESSADKDRKENKDIINRYLSRKAMRTGKRHQASDWRAEETYAQKYPVIGISQDNQDDVLVLGRSELQDIPQLTQFMDEAGNIKPDKLKEAQALFDKMCCDISIGSGRKRKDYQIGRIVLSNSGGGINVGVGTAVKMKMNRNGLRNAEIRFRFDGKYKEEAEEATQVSDAGKAVYEEGLLPQK